MPFAHSDSVGDYLRPIYIGEREVTLSANSVRHFSPMKLAEVGTGRVGADGGSGVGEDLQAVAIWVAKVD